MVIFTNYQEWIFGFHKKGEELLDQFSESQISQKITLLQGLNQWACE